jgi:hypothetical protein
VPEIQTVETDASVGAFLDAIENRRRREDGYDLMRLMRRVTGAEPRMWGPAIIGFGRCRYRYASGREGEMPCVAFSPRKANLALYLTSKGDRSADFLARLGKHRTGVSCIYVNKLADVDATVLESLVEHAWRTAQSDTGTCG